MTSDKPIARRRKPLTAWFVLATLILLVGYIWVENHYMQGNQPSIADVQKKLNQLKLPPGFKIELYARVPFARQLALADNLLFVGAKQNDKVHVIVDKDRDNKSDAVIPITGFKSPNGVAVKDDTLYIGEVDRILKIENISKVYGDNPQTTLYKDGLPADTHHGWKYIRFAPDGTLYTAQGMPCNVCEKEDPIYGTILKLDKNNKWQVFASGVRNSVGFDWQPGTGDLWFTDNGRDWLGDDLPPDELNHAKAAGMFFGFPYRYGDNVPDPEYGDKLRFGAKVKDANALTAPAKSLNAHVAALGMRFCASKSFPSQYQNTVFICEHGSWNRSKPIGYRIMAVDLSQDPPTYTPFITGWQQPDGTPWGRPVDLTFASDGSMFISDDHAGVVYRLSYQGEH